ncbi:MAG: tyrosine-type recombinase/integrase [Cryomorphaceae bacterium]|nr:tyrosine-type recombinase/integrase [Cryomorphaceae bacterium]
MLDEFTNYLRWERRRSEATVTAYEADLAQWLLYLEHAMGIPDALGASRLHLRSWVSDLVQNGINARSVNRKLSAVRTYYRWLATLNPGLVNPAEGLPLLRTSSRVVRALSAPEVEALFNPSVFDSDPIGRRDQFLLLTLYTTGLRRAELIGLTYSQVQGASLRVRGKGNKDREIPLLPEWQAAFAAHAAEWKPVSPLIFCQKNGKSMDPRSVYSLVKNYLQAASSADHLGPHALRHTFATHLLDMGADLTVIRELLGHANLSATQVYTHASVEQLKSVYRRAHPRS